MSEVVVLAGSNNKNLQLANEFNEYLNEQAGINCQLIDIVELDLPLYSNIAQAKGTPKNLSGLLSTLIKANGFVFVIPEYNGGIPPVVTNLLAWISVSGGSDWRAVLNGKTVALATASGGGGFHALMALRTQLSYIGMNTIGRVVKTGPNEPLNSEDFVAVNNLLIDSIKS